MMSLIIIVYYTAGGHITNGSISFPFVNMSFDRGWVLNAFLWIIFLYAYWRYRVWVLKENPHESGPAPIRADQFYPRHWQRFLSHSKHYKNWRQQSRQLPTGVSLELAPSTSCFSSSYKLWPPKSIKLSVPAKRQRNACGSLDVLMPWGDRCKMRFEFIRTEPVWADFRLPISLFRVAFVLMAYNYITAICLGG